MSNLLPGDGYVIPFSSSDHIVGTVWYMVPRTWLWSVCNTTTGKVLAGGTEFTHPSAYGECLKVTDALRTAHAYLIKTPKGLKA